MGANIKAIRARIKSVDSTRHITKAMELVASSKIRRAGARMESSRFYRSVMIDAFASLAAEKSKYSEPRSRSLPTLYIIIAGDRGLAGGYNNNIFRSAMTMLDDKDLVLPIGRRAVEYYRHHGNLISDKFVSVEHFSSEESVEISRIITKMYDEEKIAAVNLIYTRFASMLTQSPDITYLLPLDKDKNKKSSLKKSGEDKKTEEKPTEEHHIVVEYEPSPEAVLSAVIPEYISGVLYSSVMESYASELAARRSAMDTATKNADAMMSDLSLRYNRARQGAITQEITEIVAGANA